MVSNVTAITVCCSLHSLQCVCVCVHPSEAEDEDEENDDEDDDAEEASAEKGRKPTLLERTGSVSACDSGILFSRSQPRLCYV